MAFRRDLVILKHPEGSFHRRLLSTPHHDLPLSGSREKSALAFFLLPSCHSLAQANEHTPAHVNSTLFVVSISSPTRSTCCTTAVAAQRAGKRFTRLSVRDEPPYLVSFPPRWAAHLCQHTDRTLSLACSPSSSARRLVQNVVGTTRHSLARRTLLPYRATATAVPRLHLDAIATVCS